MKSKPHASQYKKAAISTWDSTREFRNEFKLLLLIIFDIILILLSILCVTLIISGKTTDLRFVILIVITTTAIIKKMKDIGLIKKGKDKEIIKPHLHLKKYRKNVYLISDKYSFKSKNKNIFRNCLNYYYNKDFKRAIKVYEKLLSKNLNSDERAFMLALLGKCCLSRGQKGRSISYYEKSVEYKITSVAAEALGNLYNEDGKFDKTIEIYKIAEEAGIHINKNNKELAFAREMTGVKNTKN